ncbi:hypothetical protein [Streptomyces sp. NBC_00063]|uniref:hypothetical protein n=1 Tax=Streptomyces sp. NBC_00063 TaxID=2975638 RepID=UPI003D72AF21
MVTPFEGGSGPDEVAEVDVPRPDHCRHARQERAEVGVEGVMGCASPEEGLPHVAVGADESRDHNAAGRVDDLVDVGRFDPACDRADPVAFNEHVPWSKSPTSGPIDSMVAL